MDAETQAARILHVLNKADLLAADDEQVHQFAKYVSRRCFCVSQNRRWG
jgi:50S ribosomal subunit-associated GTPase HflX